MDDDLKDLMGCLGYKKIKEINISDYNPNFVKLGHINDHAYFYIRKDENYIIILGIDMKYPIISYDGYMRSQYNDNLKLNVDDICSNPYFFILYDDENIYLKEKLKS